MLILFYQNLKKTLSYLRIRKFEGTHNELYHVTLHFIKIRTLSMTQYKYVFNQVNNFIIFLFHHACLLNVVSSNPCFQK